MVLTSLKWFGQIESDITWDATDFKVVKDGFRWVLSFFGF